MSRRFLLVFALLLGACGGSGDEAASSAAITVKDFKFGPREATVKAGAVVTWTNQDDFDHSVVFEEPGMDSPNFGPQTSPATFEHTFEEKGEFAYICGVHNSMTGTVVVS